MKYNILVILLILFSCSKNSNDANDYSEPDLTNTELGAGIPGVVGTEGIENWDKLPQTEKDRIIHWNTLFLHQSVGQDLEEGCKSNGVAWKYYGPDSECDQGLMGGIFVDVGGIPNGNANDKIKVFKEHILKSKEKVQIAVFKFGYGDIDDNNYNEVQIAYQTMVNDLRKEIPNLKFIHITPPLVFSVEAHGGNRARMKVGDFMRKTYEKTDVIFDLQDVESKSGTCQSNGVWRICPEYRNSANDPSEVNGIDSTDSQGHIGKKAGTSISKALLMCIYNCGK